VVHRQTGPVPPDAIRARRPPPPFRRAEVVASSLRTPRLRRVTVAGPALVGLDPPQPAASVRFLLPHHGDLVLPEWNGNEFLHADGSRPHLRTLTPLRVDPEVGEVDVDIVLHGDGPLATWAVDAAVGDQVAVSGTGRGYQIDPDARALLLAGDESALPAIATILDALPDQVSGHVIVELGDPSGEVELPRRTAVVVDWHVLAAGARPGDALVDAVTTATVPDDARVWVAGEAAAVQKIRRHLFDELALDRRRCTVRGYWKHGRAGEGPDAAG
jgi:NADPH-dependent ferric siderophore reductase